jgi:peptide/nickel transport system ATP-binding protein
MRLLPPGGVITGGSVVLAGTDLAQLPERAMQDIRGNAIGMVFQDPSSCLNPTMTIGSQIAESVVVHNGADKHAAAARAVEVLGLVRMPEPERTAGLYPHQLSGGMRQRAMIAAALACEPSLLIADEPTTALDVTIQREILQLIDDLRGELGMAVILVTHNLGVIAGRADTVAVMYGGRIIERARTEELFAGPRHPYTEALFDALPEMASQGSRSLYSIPGRPPDLTTRPDGCSFAPRCRRARDWCTSREPALDGDHPGHTYACFFPVGPIGATAGGAGGVSASAGGASAGGASAVGGRARPGTDHQRNGLGRPVSAWIADHDAGDGQLRGGGRPQPSPAAAAAAGAADDEPLLRVSGLVKDYPAASGLFRRSTGVVSAVAGVSFEMTAGQTFGLVGESGCGKTTVARLLVGL